MLLSVANSRPRNLETSRAASLFPGNFQESSQTLIKFVELYYEYLNSTGLPSSEISSITVEKDIDVVSNKYLTEIQSLIARNIPNSVALDKVTLYKIILQYYRTRGSEDSIHSFFKIFFDEFISIFYPRDYLFELSGGGGSWIDIDATILRTTNTNPNKDQIKIVSDYPIGPNGATEVVLQSISKFVWTLGGRTVGSTVPNLKKEDNSSPWVYSYGDLTVTSANITTWPDEALWNTFSRNINYITDEDGAEGDTQNIEYTTITASPIEETDEAISIVDEQDDTSILATEAGEELALEQNFTPDGSIDLAVSGITDETELAYIIVEDDDSEQPEFVTEDATGLEYTILTSNIEYFHLFQVVALPLFALQIDDIVNSLETPNVDIVYRCQGLDPIVWVDISGNSKIWQYSDSKSFASDRYKLHDGNYWQKYSYQIKTNLPYDSWSYDYLRFVHPAGLKLFTALIYELVARTEWKQFIEYLSVSEDSTDYSWMEILRPPADGYHTPTYQPGWLSAADRILKLLLQAMRDADADASLIRMIEMVLAFSSTNEIYRDKIVHETYQSWFKFIDSTELVAGFSDKTIEQANAKYFREDLPLFSNISSIIRQSFVDYTYYPWEYSQLVPLADEYTDPDPNYRLPSVDTFDQPLDPYNNSTTSPEERPDVASIVLESGDPTITEDSEFGFILEGNINNSAFKTYQISSPTSIVYSGNVLFNITTSGLADNTILYYTSNNPGILQNPTGSITIVNNTATLTVSPIQPFSAIKSFNISLRLESTSGPIVATSNQVITSIVLPGLPSNLPDPGYIFVYTSNDEQLYTIYDEAVQVDENFAN
jgi:hypothetical protein